jgi:hypothetical protein
MVQGHEQCPADYRTRDPEFVRVTEGSLLGAIVRLVAGFNPADQTFSRTRISCQVFKGLELGWSHLAGNKTARFLQAIAVQLPEVARYAWGEQGAQFAQLSFATSFCDSFKGLLSFPQGTEWFTAGWYQIAARGDVQNVYLAQWADPHLTEPIAWMQANNLRSRALLATAVRTRNSGAPFTNLKQSIATLGEANGLASFLASYDQERANKIRTWPEFQGQIEQWPTVSELNFGANAPVWPEVAAPVEITQTAPPIAGSSVLASGPRWLWLSLAGAGVVGAAGLAWWALSKKPKRRRRRR